MLATYLLPLLLQTPAEAPTSWEFPEHQLEVHMAGGVTHVSNAPIKDSQTLHGWKLALGEHKISMRLVVVPRQEWGLQDPFDVMQNIAYNRRMNPKEASFKFEMEDVLNGPFGTVPYAAFATAGMYDVTERTGTEFYMAGLTVNKGWSIRMTCEPAPKEDAKAALRTFLMEGVKFTGETEELAWAEDEALARWDQVKPDELKGDLNIYRTEHYIIFTNSSSGKKFGKKMEECYDEIQKTYPFAEIEGRKLMPVFLFRTKEEYVDFYVKIAGTSRSSAAASKGHAWRDYYATYYDSPVDPVHIHEATHQIFSNRLKLGGGGSWFQEGVAEYMSTSKNERKSYARKAARKGGFTPFEEFVTIPSLLNSAGKSNTGENMASNHYAQAASIIDFLRNSKFGKDRFDQFLEAVGKLPRGNRELIEQAIQRVYSVDLEGLQEEWTAYWD
ncbi:MAG: hypothetical protein ACPG31_00830 [Planctomycetota bacterium]